MPHGRIQPNHHKFAWFDARSTLRTTRNDKSCPAWGSASRVRQRRRCFARGRLLAVVLSCQGSASSHSCPSEALKNSTKQHQAEMSNEQRLAFSATQLRYPSANPLTPLTALCLQHLQTPLSLHQLITLTFSPLSPPLLRSLSRKSTHTLALPLSSSTFTETVMTSMPTGTRSRRLVCSSEVKSAVRLDFKTGCEGFLRSRARQMATERVSRSQIVVEADCEER